MKKALMILLALFLLGKLPTKVWDASSYEARKTFMKSLAEKNGKVYGCQKGKIHTFKNDEEETYFFLDCEKKDEKIDESVYEFSAI